MATRPMKQISGLPGLEGNTYTFVQLDDTLSTAGKAADAKKTGDELNDLKSAFDAITEIEEPRNYVVISSEWEWGIPSDMETTYDNGSVTYSYPYASGNKANFGIIFDGLENGKTYVLSFELITGGLADISQIKISVLSSSKAYYNQLATLTKNGSIYSCEFTASINSTTPYNALNLAMVRSVSTSVKLGNFSLIEKGAVAKTIINNDVLEGIPEESLDNATQKKLNYADFAYADFNLFDPSNVTHGYVDPSDGTIHATGSANAVTDFIPVTPGKTYYFYNVLYGYYAFYSSDEEADFVSPGVTYIDERKNWYLTVPNGVAYARFTVDETKLSETWINTANKVPTNTNIMVLKDSILTQKEYPDNPCNYNGSEISIFNKILCVGDSLTAGVCNYTEGGSPVANVAFPNYAYPKYLEKLTSVETTNAGLAGLTTAQWYAAKTDADLSGYDMAIIQLGVNDALYNNGWTQEEETALSNIITKLKSENTGIKIYIATIIPAFGYYGTKFDSVSDGIRTFVESANDPDIMLVDLALYGHTKEDIAYNNGHLTGFGYLTLAQDYKAYISHIIANNKKLFRFVQFIGTNHQP